MAQGKDKWLKRIWFVNGILMFFLFLIGLFLGTIAVIEVIKSNMDYMDERGIITGEEKEKADRDSLELQTISYSMPRQIYGTDIFIIDIGQKDYKTPKKVYEIASSSADYSTGTDINIIFYIPSQNYIKLLLDVKASINRIDFPYSDYDSLQQNIYYEISTKDTDGNGRINTADESESFISNLDGSSFTKIISSKYKVESHEFSKDYKRIYFICKIRPEDKTIPREHWGKVFLTYDIETGRLNKNEELNKELEKAKEIILR